MASERASVVIMGAMPQEIAAYKTKVHGGLWEGKRVEIVRSGIGKVNAASATMEAIVRYRPSYIIFTGVGGALDPSLKIGDIGIGIAAIDADVDARSFDNSYRLGQLPFERERWHHSDSKLVDIAMSCKAGSVRRRLVYISTQDRFMNATEKESFKMHTAHMLYDDEHGIPSMCDMESSAVLQVAKSHEIPALIIRAVSDTLSGDAPSDFNKFMNDAVGHYVPLVKQIVGNI